MTVPAVSVLMLLYNRPQFMRQAIESVIAQTFSDFEFIVLDHASETPEPFAIAREYAAKDSRMRVLRAEENRGISAGRNRLLAEARGEFAATIEDDDWWAADKLQKQTAFMQAHPDVGMLSCSAVFVDAKGGETGARKILENTVADPVAPGDIKTQNQNFFGSGHIFRSAALAAVGGWRPWFVQADDMDTLYRMEEKHRCAGVSDCLLHYRFHGGNHGAGNAANPSLLYQLAADYSARRRRLGLSDPIDRNPELCDVLAEAAQSDLMPPPDARRIFKRLLLCKEYAGARRCFAAREKQFGADWKLRLKLAGWTLLHNRLGFWLS